MKDIDIIDVSIAVFHRGDGVKPHWHDFYQMYHVISGTGLMRLGSGTVEMRANLVLIVPPGIEHGVFEVGDSSLRYLTVQFTMADKEMEVVLNRPENIIVVPQELMNLLWKAKLEWDKNRKFKKEMTKGIFVQYFVKYLRLCEGTEKDLFVAEGLEAALDVERLSGVSQVIAEYIRTYYYSDVSLRKMAEELSYSRNYLCRAFKKETGMTIVNYTNRLRVEKAIELIRCTDKKLSEISDMVGFNDFHYFSKVFKSITGFSPKEIRDQEKFTIYVEDRKNRKIQYRYFGKTGNSAK